METKMTSLKNARRDLSDIKDFVNEGGRVTHEPQKANPERGQHPPLRKGAPMGVDPTDLTTAEQFDEARRNSHRR